MLKTFSDFDAFDAEAKKMGVAENLRHLLALDLTFFEKYPNYSVINLRDYGDEPNNLLVLSRDESILYSSKKFSDNDYVMFKHTLEKKYGESTVLAYLVLRDVLKNYSEQFEKLNAEIDALETSLDAVRIEETGRNLRKLMDKVEDFVDVLIKLEDRQVREVNTAYVGYDYDVLTAKSKHLLDRCRSHMGQIVGLRNEVEVRATKELNLRIASLSDVMKKLTAITVILMLPTIIASHYGMNFRFMPELDIPWAYPLVTTGSAAMVVVLVLVFRKKGWL